MASSSRKSNELSSSLNGSQILDCVNNYKVLKDSVARN